MTISTILSGKIKIDLKIWILTYCNLVYVVLCQQLVLTSRNDHQKKTEAEKKTNRELYACEHKNVVFISHLDLE